MALFYPCFFPSDLCPSVEITVRKFFLLINPSILFHLSPFPLVLIVEKMEEIPFSLLSS